LLIDGKTSILLGVGLKYSVLGWGKLLPLESGEEFLASVNQGLDEVQWRIICIRFDPNDPIHK
jgi:hypothetical protein